METTLIILKPDNVQRGLMGQTLARFEAKGLKVVGAKFINVPEETAKSHYAEHAEKPFFGNLIEFITSNPVMVLAIRGRDAISACRNVIGSTDGAKADPGSIRGTFGISNQLNLVHGSDSPEAAERELGLWFGEGEIVEYELSNQGWIS